MRISLVGNTSVGRMLPQFPETRAVASAKAFRHDYTKKRREIGSSVAQSVSERARTERNISILNCNFCTYTSPSDLPSRKASRGCALCIK